MNDSDRRQARPFGRVAARELGPEEIREIAGGRPPTHTHATGLNGDDPGDPGTPL